MPFLYFSAKARVIIKIYGHLYPGAALELLREKGFVDDLLNNPRIGILITDGLSRDPLNTRHQVS